MRTMIREATPSRAPPLDDGIHRHLRRREGARGCLARGDSAPGEITPGWGTGGSAGAVGAQMVSGAGAYPRHRHPATRTRALRRALRQDRTASSAPSNPARPGPTVASTVSSAPSIPGRLGKSGPGQCRRSVPPHQRDLFTPGRLRGPGRSLWPSGPGPTQPRCPLRGVDGVDPLSSRAPTRPCSTGPSNSPQPCSPTSPPPATSWSTSPGRAVEEVRFEIVGDEHAVDRQVLERSTPLHLVVNAVQHGIETPAERQAGGKPPTATLLLHADVHSRSSIVVEDDGRGIDWAGYTALRRGLVSAAAADDLDALRAILFSPNFSTAQPSEMIGEGQGLATVAAAVEALHRRDARQPCGRRYPDHHDRAHEPRPLGCGAGHRRRPDLGHPGVSPRSIVCR